MTKTIFKIFFEFFFLKKFFVRKYFSIIFFFWWKFFARKYFSTIFFFGENFLRENSLLQFFFGENFYYRIFFCENFSFQKNISAKIHFTIISRISFVFDVCEIMYFAEFFIRNFGYCDFLFCNFGVRKKVPPDIWNKKLFVCIKVYHSVLFT